MAIRYLTPRSIKYPISETARKKETTAHILQEYNYCTHLINTTESKIQKKAL
jgi:hypothetical protein